MSDHELDQLRQENARLQAELGRLKAAEKTASSRKLGALKLGSSLLFPLIDRQKIVTNFMSLIDVLTKFLQPKDRWPTQEQIIDRSREFLLSILRLFIRRRFLWVFVSTLALIMPLAQIWLVFQQNEIIENQNKYFNIQVYDIVARNMASGDNTTRQIASALLAREDFELLNGIIGAVFASQEAGVYDAEDTKVVRQSFLKETGARGHMIGAMGLALKQKGKEMSVSELLERTDTTFARVINDATIRLPRVLRLSKQAVNGLSGKREGADYLFAISNLLRTRWSLACHQGEQARFYELIAPMIVRTSLVRPLASSPPYYADTFRAAMDELLVDLALEPKYGEKQPQIDAAQIEKLIDQGFQKLKKGSSPYAPKQGPRFDWAGLKRLLKQS